MNLEKQILSTNEWGLIALLNEKLIKNFEESIQAIKILDYDQLNKLINNSRDILAEMLIVFSKKDELSTDIREVYMFINKLMTEGEFKKDRAVFEKIIGILTPIYEAFKELESKASPNIVSGLTYGKYSLDEYTLKSNKTFKG